jgi:hypothetical protein
MWSGSIVPGHLPEEGARLLLHAWLLRFASERLGVPSSSTSGALATFGDTTAAHFVVRVNGVRVYLESVNGFPESQVVEILEDALARVKDHDFGENPLVYKIDMTIEGTVFNPWNVQMMRSIGDQVPV